MVAPVLRPGGAVTAGDLREVVRVKGKPPNQGGAILGYCWPGVLSMLLATTRRPCQPPLDGIEAVLVEFADLPETWQVFGRPPLVQRLDSPRFRPSSGPWRIAVAPAARISDLHTCPLSNGPQPHTGGPVAMGCATVFIGGMPAARVGDTTTCAGPPDAGGLWAR